MVIGVSPIRHDVFDQWIPIPDMGTLTILPGLLTAQLLAYQVAIQRGINPDRPRNLAKSVTVV